MYLDLPIVYDKATLTKEAEEKIVNDFVSGTINLYEYADIVVSLFSEQESTETYVSKIMDTKQSKVEIELNMGEVYRIHSNNAFKVDEAYLKELKQGKYSPGQVLVYDPDLFGEFTLMDDSECISKNGCYMLLGVALLHTGY